MKLRGPVFLRWTLALALLALGIVLNLNWERIRLWNEMRKDFDFESLNAQGLAEYRHRETGIVFVLLREATFLMGEDEIQPGSLATERPKHTVSLSTFLISKYEVTREEWFAAQGQENIAPSTARLPITGISYEEMLGFCQRFGLLLSSEAQWEYACRGGSDGPYGGSEKLDDLAWYQGNSGGKTHAVGLKRPNGFGLHDMHGNVAESCRDQFNPFFYDSPEALAKDPVCTTNLFDSAIYYTVRGGSWASPPEQCRSADRQLGAPDASQEYGFRPVKEYKF